MIEQQGPSYQAEIIGGPYHGQIVEAFSSRPTFGTLNKVGDGHVSVKSTCELRGGALHFVSLETGFFPEYEAA